MSESLIIRPSMRLERENKPWSLELRQHDLGGVDYTHIVSVSDQIAIRIFDAGPASWLYGQPDWKERQRLRNLEEARQLEERAAQLRAANGG